MEYTATEQELRNKLDSDGDGIPDNWEQMYGLDPFDPNDALEIHKSGYSWLEYYLSTLVNSITKQCQALESGIPVTEQESADADWQDYFGIRFHKRGVGSSCLQPFRSILRLCRRRLYVARTPR